MDTGMLWPINLENLLKKTKGLPTEQNFTFGLNPSWSRTEMTLDKHDVSFHSTDPVLKQLIRNINQPINIQQASTVCRI